MKYRGAVVMLWATTNVMILLFLFLSENDNWDANMIVLTNCIPYCNFKINHSNMAQQKLTVQ